MNDFSFALFDTIAFAYLAIILLVLIAQWKIFEKAGQPGWACIIPIYNFIVLMRVIGKPWWWLLLMLIPVVNIVFAIWSVNLLSKSFGKEEGFTIGLLILPFIFYPILAFGDATYKGPAGNNYVALT
ncbi:MAG: hypothetical protein GTN67_04190 [Hydrotalea flava]|uniref:DUF5684 domain-containing protein n=1 Tax=Hydrotalea TaxID=1004300 RepID=UPI0009436545|nr:MULTISPECIES: DUF5684 domain-containing protein [Hydrotalea]MBY0347289.1 hypothetical protein [Hydrotalea flava]NIM34639.1 hypothetical protein [Hydrotalea flava]NIM37481.1 hypothetical protein [Hydrotalea flava]NIN02649.1 hypothetical protein [Hydrotalea flava]NIN14324.1 hypothetical protein [Hydrotalea flava]